MRRGMRRGMRRVYKDIPAIISAAAPLGHLIIGTTPAVISRTAHGLARAAEEDHHTHGHDDAEETAHYPVYNAIQLLVCGLGTI